MASDKRPNTGAKVPVALPKTDASLPAVQTVPQDAALHAAVGSRVRVSTGPPNHTTVEGTIYVADPITNLLVLNTSPSLQSNTDTSISASSLSAPNGSYRFIPISQITQFQLQSLPATANNENGPAAVSNNNVSTPILDTVAIQNRLARTIAQLQTVQSRQGPKGTSSLDQGLFDSLARTHPMRWQGTTMIISDTFMVDRPYGPTNIKLLEGAKGDLDRMRRILDMEKNKLTLKMGKSLIDGRLGSNGGGLAAMDAGTNNPSGSTGRGAGNMTKGG